MFNPGDVIGFSGACFTSDLVNVATWGIPRVDLSHVAILANYKNELFLFESTTLDTAPCEITGKKIAGVQAHNLDRTIKEYEGKVFHYPLTKLINAEQSKKLSNFLFDMLGISYNMIGAFRAGGVGFSFIEGILHKENLHSIFCSELAIAAHREIGLIKTTNAGHFNPNHMCRWELYQGILAGHIRIK
jgi:hypothetical protein